jgi:peptidoglycan/LPS O-acetylase OafA/YrhL
MASHGQITTLDGLRGAAAAGVVVFHVAAALNLPGLFAHGWLAVDFFFALSGFVIAYAYEGRLLAGMTATAFFKARAIRLYPLISAAMLAGASVTAARPAMEGTLQVDPLFAALLFGLLVLPLGRLNPTPSAAFPLNVPVWSLFYELIANIAYVLVVKRLSTRILVGIIGVGFAALALHAAAGPINAGAARDEVLPALARVTFSFFAGVLIYRFRPAAARNASGLGLIAALLALLAIPSTRYDPAIELLAIGLAFPAILYAACRIQPGRRMAIIYGHAGRLSYAMYALHYPMLHVAFYLQRRYALSGASLAASILVEMLVIVSVSHLATEFYDKPVRAWIARRRPARHMPVALAS